METVYVMYEIIEMDLIKSSMFLEYGGYLREAIYYEDLDQHDSTLYYIRLGIQKINEISAYNESAKLWFHEELSPAPAGRFVNKEPSPRK